MVRWLLPSLLILVGVACAQNPAPSPPLVAHSAKSDAISPNPVTPTEPRPSPDLPALPTGKATLLGGVIQHVDHIRDCLTLQVFGEGRTALLFDERTRVYRDGKLASLDDLKEGERAYVDTMLDGTAIFARDITIAKGTPAGQSSGQVVDFRPSNGELIVRDSLSPEPVKMQLASNAAVYRGDRTVSPSDLRPGTLVNLTFTAGGKTAPIVQRVSILASPGSAFVFVGRVEHLDLHRGVLVLMDPRDNKSYEVHFDPATAPRAQNLRIGAYVTVQASFNGSRYEGHTIAVNTEPTK